MTKTADKPVPSDQLELFDKLKPFIARSLTLNHDINNPLAGVLGYTEFMLTDPEGLTEDQIDLLNRISQCAEKIKAIITDLSNAKAKLAEEIDVKAIIRDFAQQPESGA